jgi:hypothetical protein
MSEESTCFGPTELSRITALSTALGIAGAQELLKCIDWREPGSRCLVSAFQQLIEQERNLHRARSTLRVSCEVGN